MVVLCGDLSDGLFGVVGIGEKIVVVIMNCVGDVEGLLCVLEDDDVDVFGNKWFMFLEVCDYLVVVFMVVDVVCDILIVVVDDWLFIVFVDFEVLFDLV